MRTLLLPVAFLAALSAGLMSFTLGVQHIFEASAPIHSILMMEPLTGPMMIEPMGSAELADEAAT